MISEFPLFAFTLLAGAASGAYIAAALFPEEKFGKRPWLLPAVMLITLGVGGLCVMGHLGRPDRMLNAFANPATSGITQEGIMTVVLGITMVADAAVAFVRKVRLRALSIVGAVAAVLLALAMGNAYYSLYSVPALHSVGTWALFLAGNSAMGFALYGAIVAEVNESRAFAWTSAAFEIIAGIGIAVLAVGFAGDGLDFSLLVVGTVVGPLASTLVLLFGSKMTPRKRGVAILALAIVGMAIARYGFYATIAS